MRVFFDNCTSPIYAGVVQALVHSSGGSARHIRFMPEFGFTGATPDLEWITALGQDRPSNWIVMTGDDRIRKNRFERLAWKGSGLKGFVLARAFQKMPVHQTASIIVWRWPEMERLIGSVAPGSLFELPIGRSAKFIPLFV